MKKLLTSVFLFLSIASFAQPYNGTGNGTIAYAASQTGFGQAYAPNSNGYVVVAPPAGTVGSGQTVEGKFNSTVTGSLRAIVSGSGWYVGLETNKLKFAWNSLTQTYVTTASMNDGAWHSFAMVWDVSSNLLCFVDGVLLSTSTAGSSRTNINNIGTYTNSATYYFVGLIDEVRWSTAAMYSATYTPATAPFPNSGLNQTALWHFENDLLDSKTAYTVLTAGSLTRTARSTVSQTLAVTAASAGTSPYTYQFQRAPDVNGVPGTYASIGSNGTSLTYTDAGLTANTRYWYRVLVTDNVGGTAYTTAVMFSTKDLLGFYLNDMGDSITAGYQLSAGQSPPDVQAQFLRSFNIQGSVLRNVEYVNTAVTGSTSGQWVSSYTASAITSGLSIGSTVATIMIGTNDARASVSASTYSTNLSSIISTLQSAGYTAIFIHYPPHINSADSIYNSILETYFPVIDSKVNGTTVFAGDRTAYNVFKANAVLYANGAAGAFFQSDGLHPSVDGARAMAFLQSYPLSRYMNIVQSAILGIAY